MIGRLAFLATFALAALQAGTRTVASASEPPANASAFWSFQPIQSPVPPPVRNPSWPKTPIDQFILAELERAGLAPAPPASRRDLLRRISLNLIGLPPSPSEIAAFESDPAPDALERVVDRLLASPHYGERWGRWWLDIARYADTNGQDENKVMANAWRYRDWVIAAFNQNLPLDTFITHQLAGDLLPPAPTESEQRDRLIATGFLVLGPKMLAEQDKPKLVMDLVDEQIDTVGRAFLGLTLGCARCHDHKYDPVPTRDYYALAGIFRSTRTLENLAFVSKFNERCVSPADRIAAVQAHQQRLGDLTNRIQTLVRDANAALLASRSADEPRELPKNPRLLYPLETQQALTKLECEHHACLADAPPPLDFALAVAEDKPVDLPIHLRGNHLKPADTPVPRGFLQVVAQPIPPPAIPAHQSGRLQLAQWLVAPGNPLTARVLVNRVWQAHFGEGLVRTPDNFGLRGAPPSHPELLDWLASELLRSGWNLKSLHREILRSAVLQQATRHLHPAGADAAADHSPSPSAADLLDPENRLLSHFPRRRLDAEMIRDAILQVSGRLDPTLGGSLVAWKNDEYAPGDEVSANSVRRTVYLPIVRDRVFDALTLFDFANPSVLTAKRIPTVVAQQALFFLNSPLVKEAAQAIARDLAVPPDRPVESQVREAYLRILGRPPSETETGRAQDFINTQPDAGNLETLAEFCQALLASNEFVYRP